MLLYGISDLTSSNALLDLHRRAPADVDGDSAITTSDSGEVCDFHSFNHLKACDAPCFCFFVGMETKYVHIRDTYVPAEATGRSVLIWRTLRTVIEQRYSAVLSF